VLRFLLALILVPAVASAQADAAWARSRAHGDFEYAGLRDLSATPVRGDTVEVRIWWDGSLSGRWIVRAHREGGVWTAERFQFKPSDRTALPDSINWARRWDLALAAGLDSLPPLPDHRSPVPRDDGEFFVIQWSHLGVVKESSADNPTMCVATSDERFLEIVLLLTGEHRVCEH
jgi:hypothetical protein